MAKKSLEVVDVRVGKLLRTQRGAANCYATQRCSVRRPRPRSSNLDARTGDPAPNSAISRHGCDANGQDRADLTSAAVKEISIAGQTGAFRTSIPLRLRDVLFGDEPRRLLGKFALAVLLYIVAVMAREALHLLAPGPIRYLTFFPALMAAGFLCGLLPSIALLCAFAITGFFWVDGPDAALMSVRLVLGIAFLAAGAAVIVPASYAVRARHHLRLRDDRLALLNDELRHRVKNLLSVICAICAQTIRGGADPKEVTRDITGRIRAIASAQDLLSITSSKGSELHELTRAVIGPLCPDPSRLRISGPSITLLPDSTTSFALVLHELATNAVKYGAWQPHAAGYVLIEWRFDAPYRVWFRWREHGVEVTSPTKRGFGSTLIQSVVRDADVTYLIHPDGAECTICATL